MSEDTMINPLEKIRKIRSLEEALTRGNQALSVFREQRRTPTVPTDEELFRLIDVSQFGEAPVIAETIWQRFFQNSDKHFFSSFRNPKRSAIKFRELFGEERVSQIVNSAHRIANGRIDLLGLTNLYIGFDVDWHREPLSGKQSPRRHWKDFDDIGEDVTGDKKIIWELNRHQHFFTLGAAYWLSGDESYARVFARHLDTWMAQNPPGIGINWASSLEVSFRAMSWLWAFHFFKNSAAFTPELFKKAIKFLYLHGRHLEKYFSTYYSPNTHLTGEALGLFYLGTQMGCFLRSADWRRAAEDILFAELPKQVLPDGVYFEQSTWYQRYTIDFYTHFTVLKALDAESSEDARGLAIEDLLQKALDYQMSITMPDGRTPLIGDDDGGRVMPLTAARPDDFRGSLGCASVIFGRGDYKFNSGGLSEEVFWLLGTDGVAAFEGLCEAEPATTSAAFIDGGSFVMRDGWESTDNVLVVDCGPVGSLKGGHGHADALSIELAIQGKTLLIDSGTYTYHESSELRDYFRSTAAHNTLVIDGQSSSEPGDTFDWKSRAETKLNSWIGEDRFDFFEGSHNGFERLNGPATHTRSVLFLKNDYWIMRDSVRAQAGHEYSLNFHMAEGVRSKISAADGCVCGDEHRIYTFGDNGAWHQNESWISNLHGRKKNSTLMRYISVGVGPQEFFTFILPVSAHAPAPEVSEVDSELGRAFIIKYSGYTDLFVYNDVPETSIDTGIFDSNFRVSWARVNEGESIPDEFVLIDGDRIIVGDQAVESRKNGYAAIRRLGTQLYVKDRLGRRKTSL